MQILRPIEIAVAWIMVTFHDLLTAAGLDATSGWTWALSIVGLVVVIRIVLIPLFVKQIKASRGMQLVAPEVRKIQAKYKNKKDPASRQKMAEEQMAAYKKAGTNPLASCLPILLQAPIFFALFRVLNGLQGIASGDTEPIGRMTQAVAQQAEASTLLGASLSDSFLGTSDFSTRALTVVLIIMMSASTFITSRQMMLKNTPAAMADNPMAQQQKMIMYILPVVFAVTGVNFPIGVLIYWLTTNVWSMGQQFYVIRNMPAPGSEAEAKLLERKARRKGVTVAEMTGETKAAEDAAVEQRGQRVQPRRKDRQRRPGQTGAPVSGDATTPDVGAAGDAVDAPSTGTGTGAGAETEAEPAADTAQRPAPPAGRRRPPGAPPGATSVGSTRRGASKAAQRAPQTTTPKSTPKPGQKPGQPTGQKSGQTPGQKSAQGRGGARSGGSRPARGTDS